MKRAITTVWLLAKRALNVENRHDRFRRYALTNKWKNDESVSGPGSTAAYTENLRRELPGLLARLGIRSMLDAPCGDYNWMALVERNGVDYVGGEIVPELVAQNQKRHGDPQTRFIECDIVEDRLPDVDLWMCRDVLFHFCYEDIFKTLRNLFRTDIEWLLTSHHPEMAANKDIRTGSSRSINLLREPFCFPEPELWIDDWVEGFPVRRMGLWRVDALREVLELDERMRRCGYETQEG